MPELSADKFVWPDRPLPEIRDGDIVECVARDPETGQPDTFEGVAILDGEVGFFHGQRVLFVETEAGVLLPDPRFPVLLLERAAGEGAL